MNQAGSALAHGEWLYARLRAEPLYGAEEPLRVYLTCYRVLRADDDPRAAEILDAGYALLMKQAATISAAETRRQFLQDIPWHRELTSEASKERAAVNPIPF